MIEGFGEGTRVGEEVCAYHGDDDREVWFQELEMKVKTLVFKALLIMFLYLLVVLFFFRFSCALFFFNKIPSGLYNSNLSFSYPMVKKKKEFFNRFGFYNPKT